MAETKHDSVPDASRPHRGISLIGLIALVISSAIGSGVFALSSDIATAAAPGPALIAWLVTGIGFMGLATTLGRLSIVAPDIDGVVGYARAGFGRFVGFVSGWGYWLSIWIGNVAFGVMLVSAIGYFVPTLSGQLEVPGLVLISCVNWLMVLLVNRGVEEASFLNAIVMVCKLVPICSFIVAMLFVFSFDVFTVDFWGTLSANMAADPDAGSAPSQIVSCLMVMMWTFVGMEGASVLGHRAERKSDVCRATILGCTVLVAIYVAASILPYGYLPREELAQIGTPSMPYIFERVVGPWGGTFISAGLIVSVLGAWLSFTILAAEAMCGMAQMRLLPRRFARLNTYSAPTACLFTTGLMIQALAILMLFSQEAYRFAYSLCTASITISWILAAAYMVKLGLSRTERAAMGITPVDIGLALFTVAFLTIAVLVAGVELLMLCCIAYVPGIVFYLMASKEQDERALSPIERLIAAAITVIAIVAIVLVIKDPSLISG